MSDLGDVTIKMPDMMNLAENGPILEVHVNGHAVLALVDTGAKVTCIRPELAQALALTDTGDRWPDKRNRRELPVYLGTIEVEGLTFSEHELNAYVIPPDQSFSMIIGREILVAFVLEYDGLNGRFALRSE
jgi:predicted aspartyl protease